MKVRLIKVKAANKPGESAYFCSNNALLPTSLTGAYAENERMKQHKKSFSLFLISSSIVLLLVLQALWIKSSYERAYFDLRRDASQLLRTTVFALRDSSFAHNIERIPTDSAREQYTYLRNQRPDTLLRMIKDPKQIKEIKVNTKASQVQIYISSTTPSHKDSIKEILKPLTARHFSDMRFTEGGSFILRMGPDSLSHDSLRIHFQKALDKGNIAAAFTIKSSSFQPTPAEISHRKNLFRENDELPSPKAAPVFSDSLATDWVRYTPMHRYAVTLVSFRSLLIKAIAPQLFFSLFLTAITVAAFIVLYRNIRSQQRLMELKNDFISNMTHELKTPIATVSVALEALKNFNGMDNPKLTAEYLDIAQHELNRLTLLTDKVLKTSLFEEQGIRYVPEPVDMAKTIEQVLSSMKLVFEKNKAAVSFTRQGSDFVVMGGSIHLTNVIHNLLENALKYSKGSPVIEVTLKGEDDIISFSVHDNGIGIAPEYKDKVFEKFFRVPTGDVHTIKGYGLGLSYVDSVVKSHHGKIAIESKPSAGSTFTIILPRK